MDTKAADMIQFCALISNRYIDIYSISYQSTVNCVTNGIIFYSAF